MTSAQSFPSGVVIDTVQVCNARCPFCPLFVGDTQIDRSRTPIMPQSLFEKLVSEIATWGVLPNVITMANNGETLQDPDVVQKLGSLKRVDLARITTVLTNGQFLNESKSHALLESGVGRIVIGFDGASKEIYEAHRVRCNYERVLENIRTFVALRKELGGGTRIVVKYVRTTQNEHEVAAAYEMFSKILRSGLDLFEDSLAMEWGDSANNPDDFYYFNKTRKGKRTKVCPLADPTVVVHPDGAVAACCWDYNLGVSDGGFGNANSDNLIELWRGPKRSVFLRSLETTGQSPQKCESCIWAHEMPKLPKDLLRLDSKNLVKVGNTTAVYKFNEA